MSVDRMAALRDLRPERVCLIKPSSLGDVVHALPVLSALRTHWPDAHLAWVVNRGLRGLLDGHPDLDEVIPFDRSAISLRPLGISAVSRFLLELRRKRFDLTIDLQGLLRSGIMTRATGAPIRVGLETAREGSRYFYTHRIGSPGPEAHAVDRLLKVAEAFGAEVTRPRFRVAFGEEDAAWARAILAPLPRPLLAVNVGARWLTKRWPPEHFAEVARRAVTTKGAGLVLVGAPEDRPLVEALKAALGPIGALDLCGRTSLPRLAALSSEVDVFLSNDTGPLHLAAAAGPRVVGVYTCTSPGRTGPYGPGAIAVTSCVWCAPSYVRECARLECMTELTPDRVWTAVQSQLEPGRPTLKIA
ncbi:glycosyltransferase family 9 protein [Tundrisphaera lichenicola]|uniref:glycosyltransferase family 9 protein n=1 Tax=Tundrisphaera lichenicola TaxID=2029860 RepID=UPI003EBFEF6F